MKTLPCLQQQRRSLLFLGCLMALNLPAQEFPGCVSSSNLLGQLGRPVISHWKPRGVNFCLDPRGLSSLLPVSSFQWEVSLWSPNHLPVSSFLVYCGPTLRRRQCLRPHPYLHLFFLETFLSGRVRTTPSVLAFAYSTELCSRSAPVGFHVLSVYKDCGEMFGQCFLIFPAEPSDAEFSICSLLAPNVIEGHRRQWVILYHGG